MKKSLNSMVLVLNAPAFVVGTYNEFGESDMMTAAWSGICNSNPPCIAFSVQKPRQTLANVLKNECFTINFPSENLVKEVDYFGIVSGKNEKEKIKKANLTEVKSAIINAPYIDEMPVVLECKLIHKIDLGTHYHMIGEILNVLVDENCLDENGKVDAKKVNPIIWESGNRNYYSLGENLGPAFSIGKEIV